MSWVNTYGLPVWIFFFVGTSYLLVEDHGWALAIFVCAMEFVILILGVKLSEARDEVRSLKYMMEQMREDARHK